MSLARGALTSLGVIAAGLVIGWLTMGFAFGTSAREQCGGAYPYDRPCTRGDLIIRAAPTYWFGAFLRAVP